MWASRSCWAEKTPSRRAPPKGFGTISGHGERGRATESCTGHGCANAVLVLAKVARHFSAVFWRKSDPNREMGRECACRVYDGFNRIALGARRESRRRLRQENCGRGEGRLHSDRRQDLHGRFRAAHGGSTRGARRQNCFCWIGGGGGEAGRKKDCDPEGWR